METFKDILCKQVETLQTYFDACANSLTKGFEPYHKEFEKLTDDVDDEEDVGDYVDVVDDDDGGCCVASLQSLCEDDAPSAHNSA